MMRILFKLPVPLFSLIITFAGWCDFPSLTNTALALDIDNNRVLWNHLSYTGKSIVGKVKTDVQLMVVPVEAAAELLIADPAGEVLQPSGETVVILTVNSNIDPLFGSDEVLNTQSLFDPNGSGALQRIRLRQGKDKWQKRYRFAQTGVHRLRIKPKDSREETLPLDQWTKIRNHFYAYADNDKACRRILEPGSLLYIVSALNIATAPKSFSLCVFNKKQLHQVKVSIDGSQALKVDYLEKHVDKRPIRVAGEVDTLKVSFQPHSLAPENIEPEHFSFLGLRGDFDIYVDAVTGIPVRVSGRTSIFGKVDIHLQEVYLSPGNR
jgi:hypothetical protein